MGHLLFILYTAGLIDLIEGYGLHLHLYADDTQTQGSCRPGSADQLQSTLSVASTTCLTGCGLNTAKTEILWCSTTCRQHHLPSAAVRVGENHVLPSATVRDLGILIDSDVAMWSHVSCTVSGCFAVLQQLRSIRRSVSDSAFHSLIVSLVMPHLDCGNATLTGLPATPAPSPSVGAQRCRQTDMSTSHQCCKTFTGCGLQNASISSWLCSFTDACMVWRHGIFPTTSSTSPIPTAAVFGHRHPCSQ